MAYPAVVVVIEDLGREDVALSVLLLALLPHVVAVVLLARRRDVHRLELDRQAVQDHEYPLLVGHDLEKQERE